MHMRARSPLYRDVHLLRTLIINIITLSVALALRRNRRNNPEIPIRAWPAGSEAPYVQVIVPSRNEERHVRDLIRGLLAQRYPPGRWSVILVDDGSEDSTAEATRQVAASYAKADDGRWTMDDGAAGIVHRPSSIVSCPSADSQYTLGAEPPLRVITAPELPAGWTGKSHALWTGYQAGLKEAEWLLFVDADTRHAPDMLSSVVLRAGKSGADLLSLIINVQMCSFWERILVPQVGELYTLLVGTMDRVNSPGGQAAANGQFMLIRRDLYGMVGSLPEVRGDVAEDRALAGACKSRGYGVRLEYARRLVSARVYASLGEMWAGYSKTLFWASGRSLGRALLTTTALGLYALAPTLSLAYALARKGYVHRREALLHAPLQLVPMLALRAVVCRQMSIPAAYALTYPLGVAVGDAMLLYSIYRVMSGKGVRWKGRVYRSGQWSVVSRQ